jgi:hypothetical protein
VRRFFRANERGCERVHNWHEAEVLWEIRIGKTRRQREPRFSSMGEMRIPIMHDRVEGHIHIRAARPVHRLALWITMAIGLMIIGAGIALVWVGAVGHTELTLFGNVFKSETVGAVGIFCGTVIVILNVRRVMKSLERLGA